MDNQVETRIKGKVKQTIRGPALLRSSLRTYTVPAVT